MIGAIGVATTFLMVFGGYLLAGGKMGIILKSLPFEMIMIGGAAIGAFLVSNDMHGVKHTLKDVGKVFKGPKWKPQDYSDALCLLFELLRIAKSNPVELEAHIESPGDSDIFSKYPKLLDDVTVTALICDTLRSGTMNYDDPHQVEAILEKRLEAQHTANEHSAHALQSMADGLPALGIVAAVLGVIKTMGSIDQPPEVLGKLIGGALVGTFLGVFLAYGLVGPFSSRVQSVVDEDASLYKLIQDVLVANLHKHAPNISIEVGRQGTPAHLRPSFVELEEALKSLKRPSA